MRSLRLRFPDTGQQARSADLLFLFIGLIVFLGVLYQFKATTEAANYWNLHIEHIEKKQNPNKTDQIRPNSQNREISLEIRKEIKNANVILGRINFPWETLFNSIENAVSKDIALLSLLPNVSKKSLRITGEARNMSELLAFIEALEQESIFVNAHLLNYKIKKSSPHQPITFQVITSWGGTS
ncbi:MAG TPA: PilN domain-containing protein [Thermodesulfobacteriota bacterium]|nr:PilN domain-containing protein [Thermodesulfobacteriota bacterium]